MSSADLEVHPAVDTVARLLQADPDAGDLADLARRVGLSPSHLSRLFTAQMGLSISRFRNQQRLDRFMRLYGQGRSTTALAAAHEAGFRQLRAVPPGVPPGDRPQPLRPPHLSHRRPHLTAQQIDRAGTVRLTLTDLSHNAYSETAVVVHEPSALSTLRSDRQWATETGAQIAAMRV